MAQLTIRQVDEQVVARLRERAVAAGRSMEQEVREILAAAVEVEPVNVVARLQARLASYGGRTFSDSSELVRAMRDERGNRE
jgi:plasmid stability protein